MFQACYAKVGPLALHWAKVTKRQKPQSKAWSRFCEQVRQLADGQLWRHNQAGDLPGIGDRIDSKALTALVKANKGKLGFTYTHKPMTTKAARAAIARANRDGFTVNLSADTLAEADALASLRIGPVVVVLPSDQMTNTTTPDGRKVVICPAVTHDSVTCATCQLCARQRDAIVGFPAHGARSALASRVAGGSP
jgi:hypothetical protein